MNFCHVYLGLERNVTEHMGEQSLILISSNANLFLELSIVNAEIMEFTLKSRVNNYALGDDEGLLRV